MHFLSIVINIIYRKAEFDQNQNHAPLRQAQKITLNYIARMCLVLYWYTKSHITAICMLCRMYYSTQNYNVWLALIYG